jgi:Protein of unknown function (DUF1501)
MQPTWSNAGTHHSWGPLLNRRDLLRVGALGVAGTLLPFTVRKATHAETTPRAPAAHARSVIVLWMAGGVTHIDSFDPKPDAPAEIRGSLTSIATTLPGVRFCETLPCLAGQTRHLALVRSFASGNDDHFLSQAYALSGRKVPQAQITTEPNVGSMVAKLLGPRGGLPGYIAVPGTTRPGPPPTNLFTGGWLGHEYDPFPTGGKPRNDDFTAEVKEATEEEFNQQALAYPPQTDSARLAGRQSLRRHLDAVLSHAESSGLAETLDRQYHSAFDMLLSPEVRRAFDLGREPDRVRDAYGRTKIGQRCLLARRLVEAGARFVLVDYGYDPEFGNLWDNHNAPTQKHPPICKIVKEPYHLAGVDRAFAGLLSDLDARGRLVDTLVVFLTEFGRTPKINAQGGRDHWGTAGSIFFAGAGVQGGQAIGATDKQGAQPTGNRYSPADVAATICRALGVDATTVLIDRQGRPQVVLPEGEVIAGLL